MRYCPKCGNKLSTSDKFCDRCGTAISQNRPIKGQAVKNAFKKTASKSTKQNSKKNMTRHDRIRHNCLLAITYLVVIAAAGIVFFTLQSQNNGLGQNKEARFDETAKGLGLNSKRLSSNELAGLSISFAHLHFADDSDWDEAFDKAENGDLHIKPVSEYQFGDYDVKAPANGAVYVVTPEVGYVVSDVKHPASSKVTYVSRKGADKEVFLSALAKKVSDNHQAKIRLPQLVKQVEVTEDNSNDDSDRSSDSESSSSENDSDRSSDKLNWSDDKEEQLSDFMASFGKKMKQDYDEYDGDEPLETLAGQKYPDDLDSRTYKLYSDSDPDGDKINIGWDPDLKKDYDYQVVSIFNCNVGSPEQHITYLFAIHDNQPIVLVDQTTNGSDCMVKETANKDVRNAFANIISNDQADDD